jgi:hypothetical protein
MNCPNSTKPLWTPKTEDATSTKKYVNHCFQCMRFNPWKTMCQLGYATKADSVACRQFLK